MASDLQPVQRTIIGDPVEVAAALRVAEQRGRLTRATAPRPYGHGRVRVDAVMLEPVTAHNRQWSQSPAVQWGAGVVLVLAVLAGTGWALAWLIASLMVHLALIIGVLFLAAAAVLVAVRAGRRRHRCAGQHCGGCRG